MIAPGRVYPCLPWPFILLHRLGQHMLAKSLCVTVSSYVQVARLAPEEQLVPLNFLTT
jgi:hypothetical protein